MQRGWVVSAAYKDIIAGIRLAREGADISQRELARRLGKPPSFVNKIEQLERRMDVLEFVAIAEALGLSAVALLEKIRGGLPGTITL
jgi:transcriptional regulator with XRE-family HTH domain